MATLIITDRDREVSYDGQETSCNQYKCDDCKNVFIMERPRPNFCPRCGKAFEDVEDISV